MAMWPLSALRKLLKSKNIDSANKLQNWLESRAAYLVQKSITEYSQARANMMFSTLLGEKGFQDAYEKARWSAFPAGLSMVSEITAGAMRNRNLTQACETTLAAANAIIERYPVPAGQNDNFWVQSNLRLRADLERAKLGQPRPAHEVVRHRAREIFDALPFHSNIKKHDFEMFRNTLAFHLTGIASELEEMEIVSFVDNS